MKHVLPPLDSLKVFEAAARHLSFSRAADELCLSKGAVSYQIHKLEEHLKCELFVRQVRRIHLTEQGLILYKGTVACFDTLGDAVGQLNRGRQVITIGVTTYVATRWLSPLISAFGEQYPEADIQLQHTVNAPDFRLTDVDLAIRWGPHSDRPDPNRFGQVPMPIYPVASPTLLAKLGVEQHTPLRANALSSEAMRHVPLLCEGRNPSLWDIWHGGSSPPNPRRLISDANVRVQAAIDGLGFTLDDDLMRNEIDSGQLVAPFADRLEGYGYALLHAPSRTLSRDAQRLKEWLASSEWESATRLASV